EVDRERPAHERRVVILETRRDLDQLRLDRRRPVAELVVEVAAAALERPERAEERDQERRGRPEPRPARREVPRRHVEAELWLPEPERFDHEVERRAAP